MELVDFCMYVSPTKQEHSIRLQLIDRIKQIVLNIWPNATIHVFGSMKTKLYLPTSDIDLAVYPNTNELSSNGDIKLKLAQALKQTNMCSYLEIISTARVPLVKFKDSKSNISVDIIFERESGIVAADEINSLQAKYPALRPLTYFLKYFLWFRNLNEPFRGGMGSYLLQMLIVNLIQTHPIRATRKWRYVDSEISLGGWLMAFFELYGKHFNYSELGISPYPNAHYFLKEEHGMKVYDRPYLLCCKCPFESTSSKIMDSGRNTYNIMKIKQAFEWAYNTLLSNARHKNNNRKSILGLLVGIRGQMLQIRSKDNKLLKFQSPQKNNDVLSKISDMNLSDNYSSSDNENEHSDNTELFIPFNDNESSPSTSCSSSLTTSSSSSYDSYNTYNNGDDNDDDTDELGYYEASEFQQKHLFNTHSNTSPKWNSLKLKVNVEKNDENCRENNDGIIFSFDKKNLAIEHNPYLNQKYDPYKGQKKRRFSSVLDGNKTPKLKKRKTTSSMNMHNVKDKDIDSKNDVKLSRSYSMPDLRKSTPCIFYQKGGCKKGETCPFQHGDDDIRGMEDNDLMLKGNSLLNQVCWNFTAGHCHRGSKCRWLHTVTQTSKT